MWLNRKTKCDILSGEKEAERFSQNLYKTSKRFFSIGERPYKMPAISLFYKRITS